MVLQLGVFGNSKVRYVKLDKGEACVSCPHCSRPVSLKLGQPPPIPKSPPVAVFTFFSGEDNDGQREASALATAFSLRQHWNHAALCLVDPKVPSSFRDMIRKLDVEVRELEEEFLNYVDPDDPLRGLQYALQYREYGKVILLPEGSVIVGALDNLAEGPVPSGVFPGHFPGPLGVVDLWSSDSRSLATAVDATAPVVLRTLEDSAPVLESCFYFETTGAALTAEFPAYSQDWTALADTTSVWRPADPSDSRLLLFIRLTGEGPESGVRP